MTTIAPETEIGAVALTVSDLERALDFYQQEIGLQLHERQNGEAALGVGAQDLLYLRELPGARQVRGTSGLYHFAILVPNRRELARVLRHFADTGTRLQGFSDHLVSEALYLADPDGNGIEVYRDRPRAQWPYLGDRLQMATDPLDLQDILGELPEEDSAWSGLAKGTKIGHIHLHVSNIQREEAFYRDLLGFELITRYPPSASFLGAGGYHHHIGINIWAGAGAPPPPPDATGLRWFTIELPSAEALAAVKERLDQAGVAVEPQEQGLLLHDPARNAIVLRVRG